LIKGYELNHIPTEVVFAATLVVVVGIVPSCSFKDLKKVPHNRSTNSREGLTAYCDNLTTCLRSETVGHNPYKDVVGFAGTSTALLNYNPAITIF
jgi:hypothetical protein